MSASVQSIRPAVRQIIGNEADVNSWSSDLSELLSRQSNSHSPQFFHRTLKAGQRLVLGGQDFESLYLVNAGWFKTVFVDEEGDEQVMGFAARGDLLGADGGGETIGHQRFERNADLEGVVGFLDGGRRHDRDAIAPEIDQTLGRQLAERLAGDRRHILM